MVATRKIAPESTHARIGCGDSRYSHDPNVPAIPVMLDMAGYGGHGHTAWCELSTRPRRRFTSARRWRTAARRRYRELRERIAGRTGPVISPVRAGQLVAWNAEQSGTRRSCILTSALSHRQPQSAGFSIRTVAGWHVVALQPYGGVWLHLWLDRDLGISGRLSVRDGTGVSHRLVRTTTRSAGAAAGDSLLAEDRSVTLDPQRHINAAWGGSGWSPL